jgi:hypothetical protein
MLLLCHYEGPTFTARVNPLLNDIQVRGVRWPVQDLQFVSFETLLSQSLSLDGLTALGRSFILWCNFHWWSTASTVLCLLFVIAEICQMEQPCPAAWWFGCACLLIRDGIVMLVYLACCLIFDQSWLCRDVDEKNWHFSSWPDAVRSWSNCTAMLRWSSHFLTLQREYCSMVVVIPGEM